MKTRTLSLLLALLVLSFSQPFPALALTPLKSAEQLAQDKVLVARASRSIELAALDCFAAQKTKPHSKKPGRKVTVRFFLSQGGSEVTRMQVIKQGSTDVAVQNAVLLAIKTCAPYKIPEELRNWGGFWATVTLGLPDRMLP